MVFAKPIVLVSNTNTKELILTKKKLLKMNECVPNNSLFLSENYMVQSVENIPVSIIDCEKIGVSQLIHSGQLTNEMPVIQFADSSSNSKSKSLHPLEVEIQRDLELKCQQEVAAKHESLSVIQSASTSEPHTSCSKSFRLMEPSNSMYSSLPQVQQLTDGGESVISESENFFPLNRQLVLEKREYFIMSDKSVLVNVNFKETKNENDVTSTDSKSKNNDINGVDNFCINNINCDPEPETNNQIILKKVNDKLHLKNKKLEFDSENEENDVEPVCDYEPDPETTIPPIIEVNEKEKPNKCYMCFKTFRQKKNMYAHIRKIHSTQPKIEGGILCPLCKMHALRQEHLRAHLETLHEIPIEKEEKLFNTMEDFLMWKKTIERETLSFFVSKSSSKLLANNQQKTYYKCHRSGTYEALKKESRKKKLKVQGSNKIGATCPAAIEVTENLNGINVVFWKTHVGHTNDLTNLVLTKEEKVNIMKYVGSGHPWDKILEIFKTESFKSPGEELVVKQEFKNRNEVNCDPEVLTHHVKPVQKRQLVKGKNVKRTTQSLIIEKADALLNLLETTEIKPEFQPKVCLMIENLISTVKRRAVKNFKKENAKQKRYSLRKLQPPIQKTDK